MNILEKTEPSVVFNFFEEICKIPHGSGNTKHIADYLVSFAEKRNLFCIRDKSDNVIIKKSASKGKENALPVILQGHIDMVCEKDGESKIDFTKDGLTLKTDGQYVWAQGTTLGADDGIAAAMILAVLDGDFIHPPIEAVFTADEEIGMLGAEALDTSSICGKRLINLDSEDEGIFTVSCAGGVCAEYSLPVERESKASENLVEIILDGLQGGHSGGLIHLGRANSNITMGRVLKELSKVCIFKICELSGGEKDNAIPVKTVCIIETEEKSRAKEFICALEKILRSEFRGADDNLSLRVSETKRRSYPLTAESTKRIIDFLTLAPNGVVSMSHDIESLVRTSLNLGIMKLSENSFFNSFCIRSSLQSEKELLKTKLETLTESLSGSFEYIGDYPAWEYNENSTLRETLTEIFSSMYKKEPKIEAIHAGLECGLFCGKIDGLDCVSFGPDIFDIHTFRERLSVESTGRVWSFLLSVLKAL